MEELFLSPTLSFEKVAAEVELPEDPNAWPQEILQELYKQVPYITDFMPHVEMDRVDGEKGYGFGHVEVSSKTEIPKSNTPGQDAAGVKSARIPIIINRRKLQPFDVVVTEDAKILPLTENRLRQVMFRPQLFDITAKTPGDHSMIGQLYPPFRQNFGYGGGGGVVTTGMGKESSIKSSILERVLPTARQSDLEKVAKAFEDPATQSNFLKNKYANSQAISSILTAQPEKLASVDSLVRPTVTQLVHRADGGYTLKTANHDYWEPSELHIDRGYAVKVFGEKVVLAADMSDGVTVSDVGVSEEGTTEADKPDLIKDYGLYKVHTDDGTELVGWVFPNLLDLDGSPLPIMLFTNGSQSALQGEMVGTRAGEGQSLPQGGRPRGYGCFYRVLPNGKAEATIPVDITTSLNNEGGVSFQAETFTGTPIEIVGFQPNIQNLEMVEGRVLVPETFHWLPLEKSNEVSLAEVPEEVHKEASFRKEMATVYIRFDGGDRFSFDGAPVEKLASDQKQELDVNEALFLLAGLGVNQDYAKEKMGSSVLFSHPVPIMTGRHVHSAKDVREESYKTASATLGNFPNLNRVLVKEASILTDPVAVDSVLSLGFIHPENMTVFIEALPTLDAAQAKLCELLIAARLGLRDIPVNALESAVRNVEQVVEGLKTLAFQQN